ncbi:SRPBCC family protein [Saccharopolyspora sp. HNM0983]|uniref:SRPBCC family protein n=1 Tax=Saccharopolyspora montiporae TaxID=2781240 RepID=A0A929FYE0_9PSEU|nr:SRPBCC family protein [Saccharopolyspora sp. HNM0983]MBE9375681.1 SRPBCC family protein [Saccharopolyspora sp. HNM0983]
MSARTAEVRVAVPVQAPPEAVWSLATDWARQREWMLGTEVHLVAGDGGAGSRLMAVTGLRGAGVVDHMTVVEWQPPRSCRVRHDGELVRGDGGFDVIRCGNGAATFVWWERLVLPVGGGLLWPAVRPAFTWGLRRSLTGFAELCAAERDGSAGA